MLAQYGCRFGIMKISINVLVCLLLPLLSLLMSNRNPTKWHPFDKILFLCTNKTNIKGRKWRIASHWNQWTIMPYSIYTLCTPFFAILWVIIIRERTATVHNNNTQNVQQNKRMKKVHRLEWMNLVARRPTDDDGPYFKDTKGHSKICAHIKLFELNL